MQAIGYRSNYDLWRDLRPSELGFGHRFVSYVTAVPDAFLHKNIGERYFSVLGVGLNLMFMAILFFGVAFLAQLIDKFLPVPFIQFGSLFSSWVLGFVATFMIAGVFQFYLQFRNVKEHDRERPHSYSLGQSVLPLHKWLPISHNVTVKLVEPCLVLFLGLVFFASVDKFFGAYIIITAAFMFIRSWYEWQEQRDIVLDALDAQRFAVALAQWQSVESAFTVLMRPVPVTLAFPNRRYKRETVAPVATNGAKPEDESQVVPVNA